MLKRLELVGFKSFADKTAFDFPPALTAIVGPNGSGKSNIVDAVRWVLGEQSAKSLRGGEMADVIFNGSTSRRSFGMAEVTMTFDNSKHQLSIESEEVQITRRVYRNGEGEYLINQQPSRLRDIKQLFLGTGAGADAYCIIEQGRVDVLLQSSTRERRTIFEEAAGISRFRARRAETLRKLENVDHDLQRLRDIIDEVEKQLRSVKLQAAKAQRYQEYSDRLRELRVGLGLQEYQQLAERLQTQTALLDGLREKVSNEAHQAEAWEAEIRRLEDALARLDQDVHEQEARLAGARQQIAAEETTLSHERNLSADLEADLRQTQGRMLELNARVAALAEASRRAGDEFRDVETQCQRQRQEAQRLEAQLAANDLRLEELHAQEKDDKNEHFEQMRQTARLQNDAVSYRAQLDNLQRERERLRLRTEQAAEHLASLDQEMLDLAAAEEGLQARLGASRQTQADLRQERERLRQLSDTTQRQAAELRERRSGLASRIEILEGLERSHEGLGSGVQEVFELLGQADPGPWRAVRGMVADLLQVQREYAPLVDLALGEQAQSFLVRDSALLDEAIQQRGQPFSSRVSFLPIGEQETTDQESEVRSQKSEVRSQKSEVRSQKSEKQSDSEIGVSPSEFSVLGTEYPVPTPGLIARADQLVSCDHADLAGLPQRLLGHTLIVRDLAAARSIRERTRSNEPRATDFRFITLQGELLEPDGKLTVGTHHAETGILSRKSELRELRLQVDELDCRLLEIEGDLIDLRERITALDKRIESDQEAIDVLAEQAADLRSRLAQRRQHREGLHEEVSVSRTEISGLEREVQDLEKAWQQARSQAELAEQQVQALQERMHKTEEEIRQREQQRQQRQQECTGARVGLAQVEERLTAAETRHRQLEANLLERQQERLQGEQHLAGARARLQDSQRIMLQASAALAFRYLEKETAERLLAGLDSERDQHRQQRQTLSEQTQAARNSWRSLQDQAHNRELEVNDLRHTRGTLVERLREDYQIDLGELYQQSGTRGQGSGVGDQGSGIKEPTGERESSQLETNMIPDSKTANDEIAELRRKLSRLGSVNLDALQELAELEARAGTLHSQFEDLTTAQRSLQEIIARIDQDSRRLFSETFEVIRSHFHELFRKLFGGGMADIMLEDENDILECGVEIVARPPGKELRSISLMSGGEKTLTAVALLLAIFRSKPSPFCILDEVDAALDEANIGRFTSVLREFLDQSQFIIITHSKRTMAAADVLYGITMQESGVSKRVAVRFEDWPDDGQPSVAEPAAATRNGH